MTNTPDDREEMLRLREENLRLREEAVRNQSYDGNYRGKDSPTINVKQVNEGCLSGCGGLLAVFIIAVMLLSQCSH